MQTKVVVKRKWKIVSVLLILLFLVLIGFSVYLIFQIHIKNIVIKNTTYLKDDIILEQANIKDYPKFFLTTSHSIKKQLEKNPYIEKVTVHKKWGFLIEIDIKEKDLLFYDNVKQKRRE